MVRGENILSDEAIAEEKKGRADRINAEAKLDDLRYRRRESLDNVNRLSEEVLALQKRRQSLNAEVEKRHEHFRAMGDKQRQIREQRSKLMDHVDDLTRSLRNEKGSTRESRGQGARSLASEITHLERQQQTSVMTLKEENALIDRIRHLRVDLSEREKVEAKWMEVEAEASGIKKELDLTRAKLAEMNKDLDDIRRQKDEAMGEVKECLGEIGHVLSEIRTKGKMRSETLERVKVLSEEMHRMGEKMLELNKESRMRITEARRNIAEHGGGNLRHGIEEARERNADQLLNSLFKNGKIEMGLDDGEHAPVLVDAKESRRRRV